ncbi:hypothetical protein BRDID11004_16090 [Bradyrhizobium diazoefficiens]|uniref:Uncharacterized protein n=1 Tax=Bradyrhizobium diazoefficiens TaxID=1355477 RepID=A0A810A3W5_9BRAD|nr:hypothetical protein [Bradyrhizobium diazoefficiens]BBZ97480.1 hypothetical protein F07S3_73130 [Bradyrhizobium diazoefficiens]BCA15164.1 hypothetical protein BDHF08_70110 [Bradyrhizobium diazoefficiens]BCE59576.1 hypothetical protein XF5B_70880 [Bradyrhizobium diazoefficiens]BCE68259.1 hypothetical protein XF6B_70580 [Bradyrhizobium diazoefficiens]
MIEDVKPSLPHKKTPADATPFEREQLRFFLSGGDLAATLSEFNPSLAWLPYLSEMKLIQNERQLIAWIERNFFDVDALREVVANIHFFGRETADFLEFRLNSHSADLPPLLAKSWPLVIRHMRTAKAGFAQNEWFEIQPQLKRGDHSAHLLERLANALRPKLKVGKLISWFDTGQDEAPERPSDLMAINYEVDDDVQPDDVLAAWPKNAKPEIDDFLLAQLTAALNGALAEATDAGVESNEGYSTSDTDVPSVARHGQNEYRSGFQAIIRVMAEIWTRLAEKSSREALVVAERWRDSPFRLLRRLAMFAFADPAIPADVAAQFLIDVPLGELFLTNSSVEAYRLIRARWRDFTPEHQQQILLRICEGPPRSWFRESADVDRHIDRSRYDVLSDMVRDGFNIGDQAGKLLAEIRSRWPKWEPKPAEQAGFHVWGGIGDGEISDDPDKLKGIADSELVAAARKIAASAGFMDGDSWHGLCLSDPDRALRGLDTAAKHGDWPKDYWEQLLWSRKDYRDTVTEPKIAERLLEWPADSFGAVAAVASAWLEGHAKTLSETLLWRLWDRIADATLIDTSEPGDA